MEKCELFDGLVNEESCDNVLSTINKSSLQQYKISLFSQTSSTSQCVLLNDFWQRHTELFNAEGVNHITKSIDFLLKHKGKENVAKWESDLRMSEDPLVLFEKNVPSCQVCSTASTFLIHSDEFSKNMCKCPENNISKQSIVNNENGPKSNENSGVLYKPKFGKVKTRAYPNQGSSSHENVDFDKIEEENKAHTSSVNKIAFKTAKEQLLGSNPAARRKLGASRKAQSKFVSPMIGAQEKQEASSSENLLCDERLKHLDPKMIELIESEIIDKGTPIMWDDIAGLTLAKSVIQEAVVWPLLRPDMFTGLRRPPRGILLFGPPGTGKTLIGKCVAAQCQATFFSISASSLTSKWIGDGEKMVRALFAVAVCHQPAVIFIDEIDSLLTQRSDTEHEATRRIKTEFLVQFDGAATAEDDRLLIIGATNRPQELDEAARRRLVKRLYIPLPDQEARKKIMSNLLKNEKNSLTTADINKISELTEGYSGADMRSLCSEAAMGPIRSVPFSQMVTIQSDKVRPVNTQDFIDALQRVRPSVSQDDLGQYVQWNKTYGQGF